MRFIFGIFLANITRNVLMNQVQLFKDLGNCIFHNAFVNKTVLMCWAPAVVGYEWWKLIGMSLMLGHIAAWVKGCQCYCG